VLVLAYEPVPANFRLLQARAEEGGWPRGGWTGYQMALTSPDQLPEDGGWW
jgi:hypothetical protein